MNKRRSKIIKSKLKLKGKFGRNRKRKEELIKQKLLEEKEKELLSSLDLFSNPTALDFIPSSKDYQKKMFEDPFVKEFLEKVKKETLEEFTEKLGNPERAKEIKSNFSITSMTHKILEITQSFSSFEGKGRVITSGKACHGKGTFFIKEIRIGDMICIERSGTFKTEKRLINGVLSDTSLCLANPFKPGVSSFSKYSVQPKSKYIYYIKNNN